MTQGWDINPDNGDYLQQNGRPVNTNSLKLPAYYRLKIKRKSWQYAPDDKYGSDFFKIVKNTNQTPSQCETVGGRALQPIVDDGRALTIEVTTVNTSRHGIGLQTKIVDAEGQVETVTFKSLGV